MPNTPSQKIFKHAVNSGDVINKTCNIVPINVRIPVADSDTAELFPFILTGCQDSSTNNLRFDTSAWYLNMALHNDF